VPRQQLHMDPCQLPLILQPPCFPPSTDTARSTLCVCVSPLRPQAVAKHTQIQAAAAKNMQPAARTTILGALAVLLLAGEIAA
jgi:hypothetical protein